MIFIKIKLNIYKYFCNETSCWEKLCNVVPSILVVEKKILSQRHMLLWHISDMATTIVVVKNINYSNDIWRCCKTFRNGTYHHDLQRPFFCWDKQLSQRLHIFLNNKCHCKKPFILYWVTWIVNNFDACHGCDGSRWWLRLDGSWPWWPSQACRDSIMAR